jgi:hypothetical protein
MGLTRLGDAALTTGLTTGIFRRGEPQIPHELSGGIKASESAEFCYHGHGDGELHPTSTVEGVNHGGQSPAWNLVLECLLKALEAFGVIGDRADACLEDDRLRGCGTDHFAEPTQVGWAPGGSAG